VTKMCFVSTTTGFHSTSPRPFLVLRAATCQRLPLVNASRDVRDRSTTLIEQLTGVRQADLGVPSAHHSGELSQPLGPLYDAHVAGGDLLVMALVHHQVTVRVRGDLGQVCDDDNLAGAGQSSQPGSDVE